MTPVRLKLIQNTLTGLFIIIVPVFLFGQDKIDSTIVFQVGSISITRYELQKNLAIFRETFAREKKHPPSGDEVIQWIHEFTDRSFFLEDASEKGYDAAGDVKGWVQSMEHYMISKSEGLLEEKMLPALAAAEIETALEKNSRHVHFEYLQFRDYNLALQFLDGRTELTPDEFRKIQKKITGVPGASSGEDVLEWPFFKRGEREGLIYGMKEGKPSALLSLADGYYIIQVKNIEKVDSNNQSELLGNQVKNVLIAEKKHAIRVAWYEEIKKRSQTKINSQIVSALEQYRQSTGPIGEFDKNRLNDWLSQIVLTFSMDDQVINITTEQFIDFFNTLPLRQRIISKEMLVVYLESMVQDAYSYKKATELGITNEIKFLLDKENYRKNVIWATYERLDLKKNISISGDEINAKYQQVRQKFVQPTDVVVSVFSFINVRNAALGMANIKRFPWDSLTGVQDITRSKHVSYREEFFSDSIRSVLFSLKDNETSRPISYNGKFIVLLKESGSGSRVQELDEIRPIIVKEIENEKLEQVKSIRLIELKKKYKAVDQIDYTNYNNGG